MPLAALDSLRKRIFAGDNSHCFIERETLLRHFDKEAKTLPYERRYAFFLENVLARLSCPIEDEDLLLGRVVEGPRQPDWEGCLSCELSTNGHLTLAWPSLLSKGLESLAQEAEHCAAGNASENAKIFAENSRVCVAAMVSFARRYAAEARRKAALSGSLERRTSLLRAASSLERVPAQAAETLFDALQAIWLVHMVMSCIVGSRDFAFGRMDRYLLPFYEADLKAGRESRESAEELFAHFFMKCNEITGTCTHNYHAKPIPCFASKQYLLLGGRDGGLNDLSRLLLDAAAIVRMPEPVVSIRCSGAEDAGTLRDALCALGSQVHFFNDDIIIPELERAGASPADALNYGMVGCCRADLPGVIDDGIMRTYFYHNVVRWLMAALDCGVDPIDGHVAVKGLAIPDSLESALRQFKQISAAALGFSSSEACKFFDSQSERQFHFESLLLRNCVERSRDCRAGGCDYRPQGHFLGGLASAGDILSIVDRLVFKERRKTLRELLDIAKEGFAKEPELLAEVKNPALKFGNDNPAADSYSARLGEILVDVFEDIRTTVKKSHPSALLLSGFYSLDQHHRWGRELPGTPDGRLPGEPISENQSPNYGCDKAGPTATLKSVAHLPLRRTLMGGLNMKFNGHASAKHIELLKTYFKMGGIHLGFTFMDRATLKAAKASPAEYKSLCVRMYGFSEYFVSLSPAEQDELINRTEHGDAGF